MRVLNRIAARAPTYIADARANPGWLAMFALARLQPVREMLWKLSSSDATTRADLLSVTPLLGTRTMQEVLSQLTTTGLVRGLSLPERVRDEILQFGAATPCYGNLNRKLEFLPAEHAAAQRRYDQPILTGHFFDRLERCPAISAIRDDEGLQYIAAAYLGSRARVISTRLWWSFPTDSVSDADLNLASQDRLHFDLDDWRALKFFFYLTDVGAEDGPFAYLKGSHRQHHRRHQWTMLCGHPNDEVLSIYGAENLEAILDRAGSGIIVDPFGFHMGVRPRRARRLMLEIGFGVTDVLRRRFHGEPPPERGA